MSQLVQIQELVEQLVAASHKVHTQPELNLIIEQLSQTVLHRSQQRRKKSVCYSFPDMIDLDRNLVNFEAISETLEVDVAKMTQSVLVIFEMMKMVMEQSFSTKKPFQNQTQSVNQILNNKIAALGKNFPNHLAHTKTLQDGLQAVYWVFSESPKTTIENAIKNIEYSSNKLKSQSNDNLTKWDAYFIEALKSLNDYVSKNYSHGLTWNNKGEGDFAELVSHLRAEIRVTLDRQLVDLSKAPEVVPVPPAIQPSPQMQPVQQQLQEKPVTLTTQTTIQTPPPAPVHQQPPPPPVQQQVVQTKPVELPPTPQHEVAPVVQHQAPAVQQQIQPNYPPMTDFDKNVKDFIAAGEKLDAELQELTTLTVKAFEIMKVIMHFSKLLKKPQQDNIKQISTLLNDKVLKPINSSKAGIKNPNHLKTVVQGLSAISWVISDTPKVYVDNGIESSEFYGNKILLMKVPEHTAWNNSFKATLKSLLPYVLINFTTGLLWSFNGTDDYSELYSVLKGEKSFESVLTSKSGAPQAVAHVVQPVAAVQAQEASYPPLTDFEKHLSDFKAAYQNLDPLLKELSEYVVKSFESMKDIMNFSKKVKKPTADNIKQIQAILTDKIFKPINTSKAGINFPNHTKTVQQGISAVLWVISDTPKMALDNGIESSEFYGNKVLLMKQPEHTAWNNSFKATLKSLVPYVLMNFNTGLLWNFKGTEDYTELYAVLKGEKKSEVQSTLPPPPPMTVPQPPNAPSGYNAPNAPPGFVAPNAPPGMAPVMTGGAPPPPPAPLLNLPTIVLDDVVIQDDAADGRGALLSALNVGEDAIKAHLKHVKKGDKYEKKTNTQTPSAPVAVKKQEEQKTVKEPKKYQKDNWFVENYVNERIQFDEGEILLKQSLFVENCNNSTIIVKGKVKSVFVNKCKKTKVLVTNAVSGVEAVDCQSCEVYIAESVPSVQIDKSDTVRVIFLKQKQCDIVTSKSSGINVTYALNDEGDMEKDTPIPEQFITKWDNEKNCFITTTLDTFL